MTTTPRKRIAALKTQDITHYVPFIDRTDRPLRIGDSLTASFRGVRVVVDLIDDPDGEVLRFLAHTAKVEAPETWGLSGSLDAPATKSEEVPATESEEVPE